jgi:2-polyprenyl-3-methyl-5-hydroxy-6-metoxy-1,4-benzoquinol methylase
MTPEELAAEYDRQYHLTRVRYGPHSGELAWRLGRLLWRQKALLRWFDFRGLDVLDYGCMDGVFSYAMSRAGARVTGLDVSPAALAQAEAWKGPDDQVRFTRELEAAARFDRIVCCEVMEHMPDDKAFAGKLVKLLKPGGVLIGTVPVGRSFWDPDHKRLYDEPMLRLALESWGAVRIRRLYRKAWRNWFPWWVQNSAAVFVFEVQKAN